MGMIQNGEPLLRVILQLRLDRTVSQAHAIVRVLSNSGPGHEKRAEGMGYLQAAIEGVQAMAIPVMFAVSTNIIAFLPLLLCP